MTSSDDDHDHRGSTNRVFAIGERNEKVDVPNLSNKTDRWLHSFKQQAILHRNEPQTAAADEEWRRRGRPHVVPRKIKKWPED